MSGFVKLYASILDSSIWAESKETRLVWVTMLAMADQHGDVEASVGGLARRAAVTRDECEAALLALSSPDPDDKSGVDEGRRIQKTDRGWFITNHAKYREFRTDKQVRDAERQQRKRDRERESESVTSRAVTPGHEPSQPVAPEADREAESDQRQPSDRRAGLDGSEPEPVLELTSPSEEPTVTDRQRTDARWVFEVWKQDTGHHRAVLDRKREARIRARLRDGFTREQLRDAIQHRRNSLHLMGQNETGTVYDGIETLLRDAAQVERLLRLTEPEKPRRLARAGPLQPSHGRTGFENARRL